MKTRSNISATIILVVFIYSGLSSCSSSTTPLTQTPTVYNDSDIAGGIFKPNSKPGGKTLAEWSVAWWQWAYSIPATNPPGTIYHPLLEIDSAAPHADLGNQGSSMFFLGGLITKTASYNIIRKVTIPHTYAIFFPVAALLEDPIATGTSRVDTMQSRLQTFIGYAGERNVKIDGNAVLAPASTNQYREHSATFSYNLPANNLYQYFGAAAPAGTITPAMADGWYIMLAPLAVGKHTLYFNSNINGGIQQMTYEITSD